MNTEEIKSTVETYDRLRQRCLVLIKEDPSLMGRFEWLHVPIGEGDINLLGSADGLVCYGNVWSSQTQDREWFEFEIPYERLRDDS